ncbi:bifunctional diguanylate cyclase/phosphohydrolase [Paenibacillus terrigena]|uniref:bifunctional diguanylate cyclase/phosphohydrolase n=1 Tax=Paenibacillus terrigena TaxID=369333 RepID=UPI00047838A9|nr:diguanylate cyclase [Paenibacillus terrigena]
MLHNFKLQLRQPGFIYALLVSLVGFALFVWNFDKTLFSKSPSDWVMFYAFIASVLLLQCFMFRVPPEGNYESMDSAVLMAVLFVYGGGYALSVLFISSIVLVFIDKNTTTLWKHLLNFSAYTMMLLGAEAFFHFSGGHTGIFELNHLFAYIASLSMYSLINVIFMSCYFFIVSKVKLHDIVVGFVKDAIFAYVSTMLLSLVLVMLLEKNGFFGLLLISAITLLLSFSFKKLYLIYNQVTEKANIDQRTGLYNHSYFEEKLDEYIKQYRSQERTFSLAMLDLDDFKKYNDAYGHPEGDKLLSFFGNLVKKECEPHQFLAARYGGEEFAIIMPDYTLDQAKGFINGLRKLVNHTPYDGVDVFPHGCISFSAGLLEINKDHYDKSQLVDAADRALYLAKSKGKNMVSIYGEQDAPPQRLEYDIHELEQQVKIFLSKDIYTYKHSKRVYSYAVDMAEVLQLNEEDRRTLILGALIHDIGKLEIPRDVLNKKTKLTPDEWEMVKKHVLWGKEIVLATGKYKELIPLIELHHERYDGKGYPHGLKENEIPRLARMLCIIDSFDAMTTERPYQATKSYEEALNEIRRCTGSQFDPELAGYFIAYIEKKYTIDTSRVLTS